MVCESDKQTHGLLLCQHYLNRRKSLPDFQPNSSTQAVHGGYVLVFRFVRGYGVK